MKKFLAVIEREGEAWGAYAPDLPGLGVAAASREEVERLVSEAIDQHVKLLIELGQQVPRPCAAASYVKVAA